MESKIEKAKALFKNGFNCSQSVFATYAPDFGIDEKMALRMSASFGGGIGRMRQTCGAACGLFMLAGLENGSTTEHDAEGKENNYKLVQQFAEKFKEINGSCVCSELLGLEIGSPITPKPEARTEQYFKKRPCPLLVESAAQIWEDYQNQKK